MDVTLTKEMEPLIISSVDTLPPFPASNGYG